MTSVDHRIAQGIQPIQLENPLNQLARLTQMGAYATQNKLANLKAQEYERGIAFNGQRRNALQSAMNRETGEIDAGAYRKGLAGIGDYDGLQAFDQGQAAQAKSMAEAQKAHLEASIKKVGLVGQILGAMTDEASHARGIEMLRALGIPTGGFEEWNPEAIRQGANMALNREQQLEQEWKAKGYQLDVDRFGETKRHNQVQERAAAGNLAVSQANLGVARERLSLDKTQAKGQVVQTENGPVLVDPRTGQATPVTVNGQQIPSKEVQQRTSDAKSVVNLLDMAEPLIDQSTQGMIGAGVDSVAGAFGKSLPGAQAAAQLKALEGMLISKMPKMSGPQSDKDVLLYRQMAGQIGDVTVPRETRKAAIRTIREITQRNAEGAAGGVGVAQQGSTYKVANAADYAKVPSGALYVAPDGQTRRKP